MIASSIKGVLFAKHVFIQEITKTIDIVKLKNKVAAIAVTTEF
jgi:hypothetical protein